MLSSNRPLWWYNLTFCLWILHPLAQEPSVNWGIIFHKWIWQDNVRRWHLFWDKNMLSLILKVQFRSQAGYDGVNCLYLTMDDFSAWKIPRCSFSKAKLMVWNSTQLPVSSLITNSAAVPTFVQPFRTYSYNDTPCRDKECAPKGIIISWNNHCKFAL